MAINGNDLILWALKIQGLAIDGRDFCPDFRPPSNRPTSVLGCVDDPWAVNWSSEWVTQYPKISRLYPNATGCYTILPQYSIILILSFTDTHWNIFNLTMKSYEIYEDIPSHIPNHIPAAGIFTFVSSWPWSPTAPSETNSTAPKSTAPPGRSTSRWMVAGWPTDGSWEVAKNDERSLHYDYMMIAWWWSMMKFVAKWIYDGPKTSKSTLQPPFIWGSLRLVPSRISEVQNPFSTTSVPGCALQTPGCTTKTTHLIKGHSIP